MNKRKIIYSALIGEYDNIPKIINFNDDWEYIIFTDVVTDVDVYNGWKILPLVKTIDNDPVRTNRWHKINSHLLFDDCACTIYIDSNITLKSDFLLQRGDILLQDNAIIGNLPHLSRKCVYKEAKICIRIGKDTKSNIQKNIDFLKSENYPENNGLFENSIIFRNHNHEKTKEINSLWWNLFNEMSRRDQLSLVYVLWKLNIKSNWLLGDDMTSHRNHKGFEFKDRHNINNHVFEITEVELRKIKNDVEVEFRSSISYKYFYRIERYLKNKLLKSK